MYSIHATVVKIRRQRLQPGLLHCTATRAQPRATLAPTARLMIVQSDRFLALHAACDHQPDLPVDARSLWRCTFRRGLSVCGRARRSEAVGWYRARPRNIGHWLDRYVQRDKVCTRAAQLPSSGGTIRVSCCYSQLCCVDR